MFWGVFRLFWPFEKMAQSPFLGDFLDYFGSFCFFLSFLTISHRFWPFATDLQWCSQSRYFILNKPSRCTPNSSPTGYLRRFLNFRPIVPIFLLFWGVLASFLDYHWFFVFLPFFAPFWHFFGFPVLDRFLLYCLFRPGYWAFWAVFDHAS